MITQLENGEEKVCLGGIEAKTVARQSEIKLKGGDIKIVSACGPDAGC